MFDKNELLKVVELSRRTYGLLKWLDTGVTRGFIDATAAHQYASLPAEAALSWVEVHYHNLPVAFRPESIREQDLRPFSNLLSSYLLTSFDFDDRPPDRLVSGCGCFCPICTYMVAGRHLKPKKLTKADKLRANTLKVEYITGLAADCGRSLDEEAAQHIADAPDLFEAAAMAAYGQQLLLRAKGHVEGPAVLALWRQFAWERTGSPKKNFALNPSAILEAESILRRHLVGEQGDEGRQ